MREVAFTQHVNISHLTTFSNRKLTREPTNAKELTKLALMYEAGVAFQMDYYVVLKYFV